jgi:Malate synthase
VPVNHLMEDLATAEISRSQIWSWIKHKAIMTDGKEITVEFVKKIIDEEVAKIFKSIGEEKFTRSRFKLAMRIFIEMSTNTSKFSDFMSTAMYDFILDPRCAKKYSIDLPSTPANEEEMAFWRVHSFPPLHPSFLYPSFLYPSFLFPHYLCPLN